MQFKKLSTSDGLSNRRVLSMVKDMKGYYWFATRIGVDRYDGEKFVNYHISDNEKVRGVIADKKGCVYAFTEKSIFVYHQGSDSFKMVVKSKQIGLSSKNTTINAVAFDAHNKIWVGIASGLFYSDNLKNWSEMKEIRGKSVYSFTEGSEGFLWIGTSSGIYTISQQTTNQLYVLKSDAFEGIKNFRIQSLFYDKSSRILWIGTFSDGLFTFHLNTKKLSKNSFITGKTPPIRTITSVSDSEIWAGCDGLGIYVYNRFNAKFLKKYAQSNVADLGSNNIYYVLADNNLTWVCTYTSGVFVQDKSVANFRVIAPPSEGSAFNQADSHINAILEDSDGDIWFGTNNGVSVYNPQRNTWQKYLQNGVSERASGAVILSIYEDRRKNIWIGGFATDLICINKKNRTLKKINLPASDEYHSPQNYIYTITEDSDGYIWLGGAISKLIRCDATSGKCDQYNVKGVNKIVEINANTLMLGTINGAYLFDKRTGKHRRIDFSKLVKDSSIPAFPFINSIVHDVKEPSFVWIGTDGNGLLKYDLLTSAITVYSTSTGLSSNYVYGILFDRFNRLWISSENGLTCLTPLGKTQTFFTLQGLPENTFNFLAYYKLRRGNMLWGTPYGIVEILPDTIKEQDNAAFNLRFNTFYISYKKVVANDSDTPLRSGIDETSSISLSYNQRSFSFDFFNVGFPAPKNIVYSWKLDGFDRNWSTPTREHKAVFTNIPSGKYTFCVKAINLDNGQESEIRKINIRVRPPFWASPLAYLVYAFLLVGLVMLLIKLYRNRLEKQNTEEQINFFVNMAHDIRIPITLIKAPLNEIEQEPLSESGFSALKLAQRNTQKLFNMVSQLLDFQKVGLKAVNLHVEETEINHFVNEVFYNFVLLAKEKGINIEFIPLPKEEKVWIDRQKISLVLENLLSNSIKYTLAGGHVLVKLDYTPNGWLELEVSDNGIGIPSNVQDKIFNRFFRADNTINSNEVGSGIGLLLIKKLVLLHRGKISFSSHEKGGTSFKVELPIQKSLYAEYEIIESESVRSIEDHADISGDEDKRLRILLVEDNDELRTYLAKLLGKEYKVEQASNGEQALELIKIEAPDFILSDVIMPKISGVELCSILKTNIETCHIPVILLTSLSEREDIIKGLKAGADDYITKPFDIPILTNKIRTILANRSLFKKKLVDQSVLVEHESHLNQLDKEFIHRVIQVIEENMSNEEFSIESLASDLAMSRSVFFKKIKSLTGQSPVDLVKDIRMKKAAELLREQRYSVNEIAYLTGFPNPKYFSTAFKKYFGNTPTGFIDKEKS